MLVTEACARVGIDLRGEPADSKGWLADCPFCGALDRLRVYKLRKTIGLALDCWLYCASCHWSGDIVEAGVRSWKTDLTTAETKLGLSYYMGAAGRRQRVRRHTFLRQIWSRPWYTADEELRGWLLHSGLRPDAEIWTQQLAGSAFVASMAEIRASGLFGLKSTMPEPWRKDKQRCMLIVPLYDLPGRMIAARLLGPDFDSVKVFNAPNLCFGLPAGQFCATKSAAATSIDGLIICDVTPLQWLRLLESWSRDNLSLPPLWLAQFGPSNTPRSLPENIVVSAHRLSSDVWNLCYASGYQLARREEAAPSRATTLVRSAAQEAQPWTLQMERALALADDRAAALEFFRSKPEASAMLSTRGVEALRCLDQGLSRRSARLHGKTLIEDHGCWYLEDALLSSHAIQPLELIKSGDKLFCYGHIHHRDGPEQFLVDTAYDFTWDKVSALLVAAGKTPETLPSTRTNLLPFALALSPIKPVNEPAVNGWDAASGAMWLDRLIISPIQGVTERRLPIRVSGLQPGPADLNITPEMLPYLTRRKPWWTTRAEHVWRLAAVIAARLLAPAFGLPASGIILCGRGARHLLWVAQAMGCPKLPHMACNRAIGTLTDNGWPYAADIKSVVNHREVWHPDAALPLLLRCRDMKQARLLSSLGNWRLLQVKRGFLARDSYHLERLVPILLKRVIVDKSLRIPTGAPVGRNKKQTDIDLAESIMRAMYDYPEIAWSLAPGRGRDPIRVAGMKLRSLAHFDRKEQLHQLLWDASEGASTTHPKYGADRFIDTKIMRRRLRDSSGATGHRSPYEIWSAVIQTSVEFGLLERCQGHWRLRPPHSSANSSGAMLKSSS